MRNLLVGGADLLTFEWWTGVWIPVIVGLISIVLAGAALAVAISANNHAKAANTTAQAALDLSREIAEREREDRKQERDQDLRERRYRIGEEGRRAFSGAFFGTTEPKDRDEAWDRIAVVTRAVRTASVREGLLDADSSPIVKWLFKSTDEVAKSIYLESSGGDPTGLRPWLNRGWRVFQTEFVMQLRRWETTGEFDSSRTIEQAMRSVKYMGEDDDLLPRIRESLDAAMLARALKVAEEEMAAQRLRGRRQA